MGCPGACGQAPATRSVRRPFGALPVWPAGCVRPRQCPELSHILLCCPRGAGAPHSRAARPTPVACVWGAPSSGSVSAGTCPWLWLSLPHLYASLWGCPHWLGGWAQRLAGAAWGLAGLFSTPSGHHPLCCVCGASCPPLWASLTRDMGGQGATCWGCGSWGRKGEGAGEGHGGVQLWTLAHEDAASLSEQDGFAHVRTAGVQHHCPQEGTTVCPGHAFRARME